MLAFSGALTPETSEGNFKVSKGLWKFKIWQRSEHLFPLLCHKGWNRIWIVDFRVKAPIYWLVQKLSASYIPMEHCSGNSGTKSSFGFCFS